jgi:carboxypeptidase T
VVRVACSALLSLGAWLATVSGVLGAGPDPRYYRQDQIILQFEEWEATYPEIFHRESIGTTLVGHEPIWAVRISDHASRREPEASLLFHAAQHANEPNGTGAVMYMMRRLLEGYGHDPSLTALVDTLELWFVPILNIDGHRLAFRGAEGDTAWRKTARDNDGNGHPNWPADGVDTNRNWDWRWAEYDSSDIGSMMYKGPFPFSEPEVIALRDFILRERPVFIMDFHSPVEDPGNLIWWPWRRR